MVIQQVPIILTYKGVKFDKKITPVERIPILHNNNKNKDTNEQKKKHDKAPAALLRIHK